MPNEETRQNPEEIDGASVSAINNVISKSMTRKMF
jgi:hypothetical protein